MNIEWFGIRSSWSLLTRVVSLPLAVIAKFGIVVSACLLTPLGPRFLNYGISQTFLTPWCLNRQVL